MEYFDNIWVRKAGIELVKAMAQFQSVDNEVFIAGADLHQAHKTVVRAVVVMLQFFVTCCCRLKDDLVYLQINSNFGLLF
jgi:hypothetical protein